MMIIISLSERQIRTKDELSACRAMSNETVKFVLCSKPTEAALQLDMHVQKIYSYEAETQTSTAEFADRLSKEADDEARLTGSNKYGLLSLDEYQILRSGEAHCLKKYFSDDDDDDDDGDASRSDAAKEEANVAQQMNGMSLDEPDKSSVLLENFNNNASSLLRSTRSHLSDTLLFDDTTHLSATLAQSTSSRVSHSRYLQILKQDVDDDDDDDDDELDRLVASTFTSSMNRDDDRRVHFDGPQISSIRCFVRQAINVCQENLSLVDELLEHIPAASYEHVLQRKVRRTDCIMNIPDAVKGLRYCPSTGAQTE